MKHLLLLSILFAICNIHAFGQNITLTFLGENSFNNAPLTIDSVQIINNTNGTDTLVSGNIFSILITSLEILDDQENNNIVVYPNPFDNSANIIFNSNFYERAQINVFSVNGRKIAEWNDFISVGENKLFLESNVTGVLFLTIYSPNLRLKAKLICNKSSGTADLKLIDNSYSPITNYKIKSGSNLYNTFEYRTGDSLTFIGYSGEIVSETIHDIPDGDKTYTLIFDVTNYLPVANFDVSTQNINEGSSISFFDQSTNNPTSWEWDFGDGNSSTVQNPTHTYTTAGVYTVKLIATNSFGADTITKTDFITVNSLVPVAEFSANKTTINQRDAVSFSDQSTNNPTSWLWDFGDGNTSTVQNPNHTYATAGVYTVQLIVANSVAADTITKTNYITVNSLVPVAEFSANKTTINQGDAVIFSDLSANNPTSWEWDFGDGNT
ncbi:PKD domain-containing protein, partial [Draconibacterium sediminis]|uniref:PKD domain-containing protein n=1 Tax=Draconibacterium sediminis TaxID=1544798 RepID=UPI000A7A3753